MYITRIIPVLLLKNRGLVKTLKFDEPKYIGDPINTVKIFNDKGVDEIILLDISASKEKRLPDVKLIEDIATEAFMPFAYGGGIKTVEDIRKVLRAGAEKVAINTSACENISLIEQASKIFGSQSIIVSIDVKFNSAKNKYEIFYLNGNKKNNIDLIEYVKLAENAGAGEILINSIDLDGTMQGYDINLIKKVTEVSNVPVIACGGAGELEDFAKAVKDGNAHAAAGGSFFVFCGSRNGILITYPDRDEINRVFGTNNQ